MASANKQTQHITSEDQNASYVFNYTGDNLTTVVKTVGTGTHQKVYTLTLAYTGVRLDTVSDWVAA